MAKAFAAEAAARWLRLEHTGTPRRFVLGAMLGAFAFALAGTSTASGPAFTRDSVAIDVEMPVAAAAARAPTKNAPFRYEFALPDAYGWRDEPSATVAGGHALVGRNGVLVDFDLATRREAVLAHVLPNLGAFVSGNAIVYGYRPAGALGTVVALDRRTHAMLWRRNASLLGAGAGHALLRVPSKDPKAVGDPAAGKLLDVDAMTGERRWDIPWAGCAPQRPITFLPRWAVVTWAGTCAVSANEPFLWFIRLRDGAIHDTRDATAVLARRGDDLYVTGDDQHWGTYGPGNLTVYDVNTGRVVRERAIAPDEPSSGDVAFGLSAGQYAIGDALWVRLTGPGDPYAAAVYRYDLHDMHAKPGRLALARGVVWLGAADGDEAYVVNGSVLVAVIVRRDGSARAEAFAGSLDDPAEALVDGRFVYVRERGGRIAVFDRVARREVRVVAAGCEHLLAIEHAGAYRYASCSEPLDEPNAPIVRGAFVAL
jgi:hypothetical protein